MRTELVKFEITKHSMLRERLRDEFPEIDDETLSDTLEGITDLREMLAELVRSALDDETLLTALTTRLAEMRSRLQRLTDRAEKKRALVLRAMSEAEIKALTEADFTASVRRGAPTLEVQVEEKIPAVFWKPQPPKLDKQGLLAALKSGDQVDGAVLAPPKSQLSVRTK
jgi:hypothetical protein